MLNFPTAHSIMDMVGFDEKCLSMLGEQLNQRYLDLKAEVYEAEQIRKRVYDILWREEREQPRRTLDMNR